MPGRTINDCLAAIDIGVADLSGSASLQAEWAVIKKAYFKKILACHPDKGGDAATFRDVQATFEVLRKLFDESAIKSFADEHAQSTADLYRGTRDDLKGMSTPSWEYYAEAAKEVAVSYRVELARSNRSRCQARGTRKQCSQDPPFIEKGALRVGFMLESGGYGLWVHLACWRVPSKVWLGLPDPAKCRDRRKFEGALLRMDEVSLRGVGELARDKRRELVRHVMDKRHWTYAGVAEKVRRRPAAAAAASAAEAAGEDASGGGARGAGSDLSLVAAPKERARFVAPVPGRGAPAGSLVGQTFVLTGIFPEVGGGEGLQLGKERVRKMITSFGGKVTSAVSGRTDVLVVGKDPGFGKVSQARRSPKVQLLGLHDLKVGLERGSLEDAKAAKPMLVRGFSKGFSRRRGGPNGMALRASEEELAVASGDRAPSLEATAAKGPRAALKAPGRVRKRPAGAARGAAGKARRLRR